MPPKTLLIAGDIGPRPSNEQYFIAGDLESLLGEALLAIWRNSDARIFNLECLICDDRLSPLAKDGPNLYAKSETIRGITSLKPSLITLANNHVLDYGKAGIDQTLTALAGSDISYIGVGENVGSLIKTDVLLVGDKRIGFYAVAESEESVATKQYAGANPYDD
ncbi:MAG: CapA family protein [Streptococcaceae bacterium]|jgi:poly-gamma-glutamate synthesis protein (capsule biosynthesis protein)|nr:CapA family protein [Streptococcaceae bacterium]